MFIARAMVHGVEKIITPQQYMEDRLLQRTGALTCMDCGGHAHFVPETIVEGNLYRRQAHFAARHSADCDIQAQDELTRNAVTLDDALAHDLPILVHLNFSAGFSLKRHFTATAHDEHPEWQHEPYSYTTMSARSAEDIRQIVASLPEDKQHLLRFRYQSAEVNFEDFFIGNDVQNMWGLWEGLILEPFKDEAQVTVATRGRYAQAVPRSFTVGKPSHIETLRDSFAVVYRINYTPESRYETDPPSLSLRLITKDRAMADFMLQGGFTVIGTPSVDASNKSLNVYRDAHRGDVAIFVAGKDQIAMRKDAAPASQQNFDHK